jgi:hypothetical protein
MLLLESWLNQVSQRVPQKPAARLYVVLVPQVDYSTVRFSLQRF